MYLHLSQRLFTKTPAITGADKRGSAEECFIWSQCSVMWSQLFMVQWKRTHKVPRICRALAQLLSSERSGTTERFTHPTCRSLRVNEAYCLGFHYRPAASWVGRAQPKSCNIKSEVLFDASWREIKAQLCLITGVDDCDISKDHKAIT